MTPQEQYERGLLTLDELVAADRYAIDPEWLAGERERAAAAAADAAWMCQVCGNQNRDGRVGDLCHYHATYPTRRVDRNLFTAVDGVLAAEASTLGLAPGEWPDELVMGSGYNAVFYEFAGFEGPADDPVAARYLNADTGILVYND